MSTLAELNARTIDGVVYLDSNDVIAALRRRATEATAEAESYGDELDEGGFPAAVTWHAVAAEMNERADELQFATIAHQTEGPEDSPMSHDCGLDRTARTVKGQFDDTASVESGRGSVYLQAADEIEKLTIALSPDAADGVADLLRRAAIEARKR